MWHSGRNTRAVDFEIATAVAGVHVALVTVVASVGVD